MTASRKITAVFAVIMMVAVAGVVVFTAHSDADGINDPVTNGKMTVNLSYGGGWELPMTVDAYNGAIALDRNQNQLFLIKPNNSFGRCL